MPEALYPVRITTDRVVLREFRPEDLDDSMHVVGDDRVTTWLSFDSKSRAEQQELLTGIIKRAQETPRTEYYLAACRPEDDRLGGFARLGLTGVRAARLGGATRTNTWGHGLAAEGARALITFGFTELGLHRISAAVGPDNAASLRLVEKLGMTYEGRIRDHVFTNGAWRDSLLYSLLEHEWDGDSVVK